MHVFSKSDETFSGYYYFAYYLGKFISDENLLSLLRRQMLGVCNPIAASGHACDIRIYDLNGNGFLRGRPTDRLSSERRRSGREVPRSRSVGRRPGGVGVGGMRRTGSSVRASFETSFGKQLSKYSATKRSDGRRRRRCRDWKRRRGGRRGGEGGRLLGSFSRDTTPLIDAISLPFNSALLRAAERRQPPVAAKLTVTEYEINRARIAGALTGVSPLVRRQHDNSICVHLHARLPYRPT